MLSSIKTDKQRIAHLFGKAAQHYDNYANIQRYSGHKLMDWAQQTAGHWVLDAGCGTGYFSEKWKQQGKGVIALDLSHAMLQLAKQQQRADFYLQSDIEHCAIAPNSMDMVFSNLALQWCDNLSLAIKTLMQTLQLDGALYFSTLAAATMQEVRTAWQPIDKYAHANPFLSLQQIKMACLDFHSQLDTETVIERYDSLSQLFASLKGVGANFVQGQRQQGLMTKQKLQQLENQWPTEAGQYLLTYQLVRGKISHG